MALLKQEVFDLINEFKSEKATVDWTVVWDDDDLFESALDALDTLINNVALLEDIDEKAKIEVLGKLAIARAKIAISYPEEKYLKDFIDAGQKVTQLLQTLTEHKGWISKAEERFDEYISVEEESADDEVTHQQLEFFRPVFIAIALLSLITLDQEEYR